MSTPIRVRLPIPTHEARHIQPPRQVALPGALVLVFNQHKELCLLQRDDSPLHCLLGGRLDPHETFAEGCAREVLEETGANISPESLEPLAAYHMGYERSPTSAYGRLYAVTVNTDETNFTLGNEGVGLVWLPLSRLPKNISFPQALLVDRVGGEIKRYLRGGKPRTTAETDSVVHVCMAAGTAMSNFNTLPAVTRRELLWWRDHPHVKKRRFDGTLAFDLDSMGMGIQPVQRVLKLEEILK